METPEVPMTQEQEQVIADALRDVTEDPAARLAFTSDNVVDDTDNEGNNSLVSTLRV